MGHRIEVRSKIGDPRADDRSRKLNAAGIGARITDFVDVYTIDADLDEGQLQTIAGLLINPVTHEARVDSHFTPVSFDSAVEVGYLPGVTDNVGNTVSEEIQDTLRKGLGNVVHSSRLMFVSNTEQNQRIPKIVGDIFSNPVINRVHVKEDGQFRRDSGMDLIVPRVNLQQKPRPGLVNIVNADDDELKRVGSFGVYDYDLEIPRQDYEQRLRDNSENVLKLNDFFTRDGKYFEKVRRGTLSMKLPFMKAVQSYFASIGRDPTRVEMESIAQTWSEHCCHNIFSNPIDDIKEGLFNRFIRKPTEEIRKKKGDKDLCVSVFSDNAGVIKFNDKYYIVFKVETHNAPSALDPYGGAGTGIVGVIRDPMGTGLGSLVFLLISGPFCFSPPDDTRILYRDKGLVQKMLSSRQINDGVTEGVKDGGNCSGVPTTHLRNYFDSRYRGKPLVPVGALGVMPVESAGRPSHIKKANDGDYIVMVGGRVGKDGIHGATFSSETLSSGSPVTAVQICDAITQKKESDMLIKEARDRALYNSITDNGAGGLSSSVGEMAKESGGCHVYLEKVPVKYPGIEDDEIWVSESQERMTLSVPKEKWAEFSDLAKRRGVEATVIGEFTNSGKCVVEYNRETVMDVDLEFLHNGRPKIQQFTTFTRKTYEEPDIEVNDLTKVLHSMLKRDNIASLEYIARQFDHEVQGGSVIKPIQGKGRVYGNATVTRPILSSKKGVVVSQGINPSYSDIDTYHMAANAVDSAIRNAVSVGCDLEKIVLLDNFCWCESDKPERLGQLKRACEACADYTKSYGTPFGSGKDSMFNQFKGFDENGNPVEIAVPPTLIITAVGIMDDTRKAVTLYSKKAGDLVYVLGFTHNELGGSEYFRMLGEETRGEAFVGNSVPKVDAELNSLMYRSLYSAVQKGLIASCASVEIGGLGVALAKKAIGGRLGMEVDLNDVASYCTRDDYTLFSQSAGRLVVTVNPKFKDEFEKAMGQNMYKCVGKIRGDDKFIVRGKTGSIDTTVDKLEECYKGTFKDF